MERLMGAMLPTIKIEQEEELEEMSRRLSEAMSNGSSASNSEVASSKVEFDASFTFSEK